MRLTGIETMILSALFLDERLTVMQHAAFVIGTVGAVLLVLTPGKAGIRLNRATGTILLITSLLAIESIVDLATLAQTCHFNSQCGFAHAPNSLN